eukprot:1157746-Pelagomonas_calceolata.AAC.3
MNTRAHTRTHTRAHTHTYRAVLRLDEPYVLCIPRHSQAGPIWAEAQRTYRQLAAPQGAFHLHAGQCHGLL